MVFGSNGCNGVLKLRLLRFDAEGLSFSLLALEGVDAGFLVGDGDREEEDSSSLFGDFLDFFGDLRRKFMIPKVY